MSEPPPLRVAYLVSPSAHFAGIERVVHEIASGLARAHPRTLDVHVVFGSHYEDEALRAPAYTAHVLGVDRLLSLGGPLRRLVAERQFDVLVTPQVEATVVAFFATRGLGVVVVPHLHGNPRLERDEGTARTRASFSVFERVVAPRVPAVIAVSPSLRDYAAATIAARTRTVFARNPVRDLGSPQRLPADDDRFRFVCVARLTRQKGQDVLLRAIASARDQLPPFTLSLVGDGDAAPELRALCTELGLDDVVAFAGYLADPIDHLRAADCFVLSSRWEGFGVALVEALQAGLPLLAADCDFGPADVITDGAIGTLVEPDDVEAMARGLVREARRADDAISQEQRRTSARRYLPDEAVATHYSVLQSVAPAPRAGR